MVMFRARHACLCYVAPAVKAVQPPVHFQKGAANSKQVSLLQLPTIRRARQQVVGLGASSPTGNAGLAFYWAESAQAVPLEVQVLLSTEQKVHKPGT